MRKKPFFSIVIPTYNRASDLRFALYCIFRQSFPDFEVVIFDNCSTDDTQAAVNNLNNRKIRYFRTRKTLGNALNIRKAIEQAKGTYIFLHSDDDFLPYPNSLQKIYKEITKHEVGYIRLNYLSLSLDKKWIFTYKLSKPFVKNEYVPPFQENERILTFILDSDPYFITGIIFKNIIPRNIQIVDSDPAPWIEVLFYMIKNFGSCFIAQPHIVASWSRRTIQKNAKHHIFSLTNGKLRSENYLNAVKKYLSREEYNIFLHNELMLLYVRLFPVIKVHVGDEIMINMSRRICLLDPSMKKSVAYWTYLVGTLILPRYFLKIIRDICIYLYPRFSQTGNPGQIIGMLKNLELGFSHSPENVRKINDPLFKF